MSHCNLQGQQPQGLWWSHTWSRRQAEDLHTQSITKPQGGQLSQRWAKPLHPYADKDSEFWRLTKSIQQADCWSGTHTQVLMLAEMDLTPPKYIHFSFGSPQSSWYMLVCSGCGWFKQKKCILSVLEARSARSRCWWGWFLLRPLYLSCKQLPSCCLLPLLSLCVHTPLVSLCVSDFLFL